MIAEPFCTINIPRKKIILCLISAMVALLTIHVALQIYHYEWHKLPWLLRQFFDVDEEDSLPTWYSTSILLLASILLFLVALNKQASDDRWTRYWFGLSFTFIMLSMDEVAGFHETINTVTRVSWVIPGAAVALLFGLAYIRFLRHLPSRTRWLFILSGCIFLGGALGIEKLTAFYKDAGLLSSLGYNLMTSVEEGLEMSGVILFIYAILEYMETVQNTRVDIIAEGDAGDSEKRKGSFLSGLRTLHGWLGIFVLPWMIIMGITGFYMNHPRLVLVLFPKSEFLESQFDKAPPPAPVTRETARKFSTSIWPNEPIRKFWSNDYHGWPSYFMEKNSGLIIKSIPTGHYYIKTRFTRRTFSPSGELMHKKIYWGAILGELHETGWLGGGLGSWLADIFSVTLILFGVSGAMMWSIPKIRKLIRPSKASSL